MNEYNRLAPYYNFFKKLVFGNRLQMASETFTQELKVAKNILVVGGGHGKILQCFSAGSHVTFVDSSSEMILQAQNQTFDCNVEFVHSRLDQFETTQRFDLIVSNFFLDLFDDKTMLVQLECMSNLLSPTGQLIITDFKPIEDQKRLWQRLLLRTTILFFALTTGHRLKRIFNITQTTKSTGFEIVKIQHCVKGMVFASLWKKRMY